MELSIPLPWQAALWNRLQQARRQGRLAHGLLLGGPPGLGKRALAVALAHGLLCEAPDEQGRACGRCRACRLLAADSHPDFHLLEPEEDSRQIRIEAVRRLVEACTLTVGEGRRRVFVLHPADAMAGPAANALLKTLEEPLAGVHILLVSHHPERLPATIRSRCQILRLAPPTPEAGARWLMAQGLERADALERLTMTGHAPLAALEQADAPRLEAHRRRHAQWRALAAGEADPVVLADQWAREADSETLLRELTAWTLQQLRRSDAGAVEAQALHRFLDRLFETRRELHHNLNLQLVLEDLLIHWQGITTGEH